MGLPKIDNRNIHKPLCYDPKRKKFITFNEIVSGKEKIVLIEDLSLDDVKKLVIKRIEVGPEFTMQPMSGTPMTKKDIITAIINDNEIGRMTIEAEVSMLKDLLRNIANNL